jgi:hypothetical protein
MASLFMYSNNRLFTLFFPSLYHSSLLIFLEVLLTLVELAVVIWIKFAAVNFTVQLYFLLYVMGNCLLILVVVSLYTKKF